MRIYKISKPDYNDFLHNYYISNNLKMWNASLPKICFKEGIKFYNNKSINSEGTIKFIKNNNLDLLINAGGEIFKHPIIKLLNIGILNPHMGYLPKYRGMNVMEWSIFQNDKTGVTLHFIERQIDLGDIILFKEIPIDKEDTISSIRLRSQVIEIEIMIEGIKLLKNGNVQRIKQKKKDGKQYFAMHNRLKEHVNRKIKKYCQ